MNVAILNRVQLLEIVLKGKPKANRYLYERWTTKQLKEEAVCTR